MAPSVKVVIDIQSERTADTWRIEQAWMLCDFRLKMEHENGGPLTDEPSLAYFLSDLCDFLNFNPGERALVMGESLLVYMNQLDFAPAEAIQIVNTAPAETAA